MECTNEKVDNEALEWTEDGEEGPLKKKWANLFEKSLAKCGRPLTFIAPDIKEGRPIAKLRVQEVRKVEASWKFANVLFTPDEGIRVVNIQIYLKTLWPLISPVRILKQE